MNGLEGCYCERTCSVKGVIYREDEGWTDGCRNCTCSVGFRTRGRPSFQPALHVHSLWTSHYVCNNSPLRAIAYFFAFVATKVLKLLFFSLVHQMSEGVCGCVFEPECGSPVVGSFYSHYLSQRRWFAASSCKKRQDHARA